MKIINISRKKFNSLNLLELDNHIISTEGNIYEYNYTPEYPGLIKKLHQTDGYSFGNKLYTLEMLDFYKNILPNCFIIPDNLVSMRGEIIGFTLKRIPGNNLSTILLSKKVDTKDKIYYLKGIGTILDKLENIRKYTELKDLYITDLQECNFIVNPYTKDLYVIDLDSCKIAGNIASPARYLTPTSLLNNVEHKYTINKNPTISAHVIPNANSDLYCYCIIVLKYLAGMNINNISLEEFYNYLNYLEYIGIHKELISGFNKIVSQGDNVNIGYYLDSLTQENIVRSKIKVYEKVTKNGSLVH